MFYGFVGFCEEFTSQHPEYTIYPIRINGSAVESFFSQLKHTTSGHLSSVNYATAQASILSRGIAHGKDGNYRNAPLFIRQHEIQKEPQKR